MNALLRAIQSGDASRALTPDAGRTSLEVEHGRSESDYAAAGYQRCGPLAVRLDMLERLADLIRENRARHGKGRFEPGAAMCSLMGCSNEELRQVLKALGYRRLQKPAAPEGAEPVPELWGGRSRALKTPAKPQVAPAPKPDSPFAVLAELKPQPERRPAQSPAKGKAKPAHPGKPKSRRRTKSKSKPEGGTASKTGSGKASS
jgi:ATP-dependent RNA helicase SUPV3L1/SUV3